MEHRQFYAVPPPPPYAAHAKAMRPKFEAEAAQGLYGPPPASASGAELPLSSVAPFKSSQSTTSALSIQGWGGQAILEDNKYRVPWFGRGQAKRQYPRTDDAQAKGSVRYGDSGPPGQPSEAATKRESDEAMSFEDLVAFIQRVPKREPLPDRVYQALHHMDSRALSIVLKELSRIGVDKRAVELFDHLRTLPDRPRHPLRQLCDVYTFTTMISVCIYQQDVDRAMELLSDMRERGIDPNVRTYTALMNVCIKCGRLPLALDIFDSMIHIRGCTPNVVTYNTLIDVYGKLGQWEKAIQVLDIMEKERVEPVLRTYNTLIIACNMCNRPREALAVASRLQADGFAGNSTTCNALISAYGKVGQLDKALDIYQKMVAQNIERGVITYSSLISACEKAGQWETALSIFATMQSEGCTPNIVTYNSFIKACAHGGQWEKANEVFEQMNAKGYTPDVVTYTSLISACERGGQWQRALHVFHKMCMQGCKPDAIVFNAIIDSLWGTGITWAQSKALQLFHMAQQQGHFKRQPVSRKPGAAELDLHGITAGVAMLSLYTWLQEIRDVAQEQGLEAMPAYMAIVTDLGKASKEQSNCIVKEAVPAMMSFWEAPFRPAQSPGKYAAVLEASGPKVAEWVCSQDFSALMASVFPVPDMKAPEQEVLHKCSKAFEEVQHFEATHGLLLDHMSKAYLAQRPALICNLVDVGQKLGLADEVGHDAVLLMDRAASQTNQVPEGILPLLGIAALTVTSNGSGNAGKVPTVQALERASDVPAAAITNMQWTIRQLLSDDMAAISTMRCLKLYLERLGFSFMGKDGKYGMAGLSVMLAVEALYDLPLLNCRPSVAAAALMYADRRVRGMVPFWPVSLAKMTGYEDMGMPDLQVAMRSAQKLVRKGMYAQVFRTQLGDILQGQISPPSIKYNLAPGPGMVVQRQQQPGSAEWSLGSYDSISNPSLLPIATSRDWLAGSHDNIVCSASPSSSNSNSSGAVGGPGFSTTTMQAPVGAMGYTMPMPPMHFEEHQSVRPQMSGGPDAGQCAGLARMSLDSIMRTVQLLSLTGPPPPPPPAQNGISHVDLTGFGAGSHSQAAFWNIPGLSNQLCIGRTTGNTGL